MCDSRLEFDNAVYEDYVKAMIIRTESSMPFKAYSLFEVFPFSILFDENLKIRLVGTSLRLIIPYVLGQCFPTLFGSQYPLLSIEDIWWHP